MRLLALVLVGLALAPSAAGAEMQLPPGFTAQVYATGDGFDSNRVAPGILPFSWRAPTEFDPNWAGSRVSMTWTPS